MDADEERERWNDHGFFVLRGFRPRETSEAMLERVIAIGRQADGHIFADGRIVTPEQNLADGVSEDSPAEARISKVFKLHRDPVFRSFIESDDVLEIGRRILAPELDCFLSQFIFKNPGAWGQP